MNCEANESNDQASKPAQVSAGSKHQEAKMMSSASTDQGPPAAFLTQPTRSADNKEMPSIPPSVVMPSVFSFATRYVVKGAAQSRDRSNVWTRHAKERRTEARAKLMDLYHSLPGRKLLRKDDTFVDYQES
ncbi:hypothetical protein ACUXV3_17810 [Roseobacteraceae bacterium NS-SX3]